MAHVIFKTGYSKRLELGLGTQTLDPGPLTQESGLGTLDLDFGLRLVNSNLNRVLKDFDDWTQM